MTIDTNRLRDLARHQAKILGEKVEDSLIWKAADEIEGLRKALKPFAAIQPSVIGSLELPHYWVVNGTPNRSSFTADDLRTARTKFEGSVE